MGDRSEESFVGQRFAAAGYLTVVTSYRLSPRVSHPAHIQDAAAAFAWVKRNVRQHGGDPDRIIVIGHSAGAYLAMLLATDSRYLAAHKLSPGDIKGLVPVSGFFWVDKPGVAPDRPTYVWGTDQKVWIEASPAHYLRAGLPPVLLIDTDGDEDWRQQQNVDMAAALRAAGNKDVTSHQVKGRTHMSVWTEMLDGESEETSSWILRFAQRVCRRSEVTGRAAFCRSGHDHREWRRHMTIARHRLCLGGLMAIALMATGVGPVHAQRGARPNGEWPTYGGDLGNTK